MAGRNRFVRVVRALKRHPRLEKLVLHCKRDESPCDNDFEGGDARRKNLEF